MRFQMVRGERVKIDAIETFWMMRKRIDFD
jgi:hypothetical protein